VTCQSSVGGEIDIVVDVVGDYIYQF